MKLTLQALNRKLNELIIEVCELKQKLGVYDKTTADLEPEVKRVSEVVSQAYGLPIGTLFIKTQQQPMCEAKMLAMSLIKAITGRNSIEVGKPFGQYGDNVNYGIRQIKTRYKTYKPSRALINQICADLLISPELLLKINENRIRN